jgi:hypothetical protein
VPFVYFSELEGVTQKKGELEISPMGDMFKLVYFLVAKVTQYSRLVCVLLASRTDH